MTNSEVVAALVNAGNYWSGSTFTYSIPGTTATWTGYAAGSEPFVGAIALNAGQAARFTAAIAAWDQLIAPNFVQVADSAPGQFRVEFTGSSKIGTGFWGFTYEPPAGGTAGPPQSGDIWIGASHATGTFAAGTYDFQALLHEIGHALGLKHPFEAPALPAAFENDEYTVMSYTQHDWALWSFTYSATNIQAVPTLVYDSSPMMLDIIAVQSLYGAETVTNSGSSTYTFDQNTPFKKVIYDPGGVDMIDASSFTRPSNIDLTPGAYSDIGLYTKAMQIAEWTARAPQFGTFIANTINGSSDESTYTAQGNLGIASSTLIENAYGGAGGDTITGNSQFNLLMGNGGNDFIRGLDGTDYVDGGEGDDDVNGNVGTDTVFGGPGNDTVRGGKDDDIVYGNAGDDPHVNGNVGNDLVYGGVGNDTVFGGQDQDTLYGEDGNDWLSGDLGNDILVGGAGADRFIIRAGGGADWASDFSAAAGDRVQLSPGQAYTLVTVSGQVVVDLGGGTSLGLAGVASLGAPSGWLVFV